MTNPTSDSQDDLCIKRDLQALKGADGQYVLSNLASMYGLPALIAYIQANYLSRAEVERAIGDDRPYQKYEPCPHGGGMQYQCHCDGAEENIRSEIRQALGLDTKKKGE